MQKLNNILIIIILLVLLIFGLLLTNTNSNSKFGSTQDILGYIVKPLPINTSLADVMYWYIQPIYCGHTPGASPTGGYTALNLPQSLSPIAPIILGEAGDSNDVTNTFNNMINYMQSITSNLLDTVWLNENIQGFNKWSQPQKSKYINNITTMVKLVQNNGGAYLNMLQDSYLSVCGINKQILSYIIKPSKQIDIFSPDSDYIDLFWSIQPIHCGDKTNNDLRGGYTALVLPESLNPLEPIIINRKYNDLLSPASNTLLSTSVGNKQFLGDWINNDINNPVVKDINDGLNTFYPGTTKSTNYINYLTNQYNLFKNNDVIFPDEIPNNFNKFCSLKENFTANINTNIIGNTGTKFIIYDPIDSIINSIIFRLTTRSNNMNNMNTNISFGPTGNKIPERIGNTGNKLFGSTGNKIPERIGNTGNTGNKLFGPTGGNNLILIQNIYYDTSAISNTGNTITNVLKTTKTSNILKSSTANIVTSITKLLSTTDIGFSYYSTATTYVYTIFTKDNNYSNAINAGSKLKNKAGSPTSSVSYIISKFYNESPRLYSK